MAFVYIPRAPTAGVLYEVVRGHLTAFLTYWYFQTTPTLMSQVADACQRHFEGGRP